MYADRVFAEGAVPICQQQWPNAGRLLARKGCNPQKGDSACLFVQIGSGRAAAGVKASPEGCGRCDTRGRSPPRGRSTAITILGRTYELLARGRDSFVWKGELAGWLAGWLTVLRGLLYKWEMLANEKAQSITNAVIFGALWWSLRSEGHLLNRIEQAIVKNKNYTLVNIMYET